MRVDGVRSISYDYQINNSRLQDFSSKPVEDKNNEVSLQQEPAAKEESVKKVIIGENEEKRASASVNDIAESISVVKDFEVLGRDADIKGLDITSKNALANKDKVLSQYQYFAGTGNNSTLVKDDALLNNTLMNFSLT